MMTEADILEGFNLGAVAGGLLVVVIVMFVLGMAAMRRAPKEAA